ncbi:MAG TPA: polyphosphate:AMP phosphotransferase [Planctomycetota bacterium]|nr:polyphosphate:AMP phosphotransferase [Planctomycetota bacterium]
MFESAELGHKLSDKEFQKIVPDLRVGLLDAQYQLFKDGRFSVIILISGVRGAGKSETVQVLNEWMDPRHIETVAFDAPTDEERERPPLWRYWRALPPRGKVGILFGSWYTQPIVDRVLRTTRRRDMIQSVEEINGLERMLADEGTLLLKFWFHLSKKRQKKRLHDLALDAETAWRVEKRDKHFFSNYDRFVKVSAEILEETSHAHAPWIVVEGTDTNYRYVTAGKTILETLRGRLADKTKPKASDPPPLIPPVDKVRVLDKLDLSLIVPKGRYEEEMDKLQGRLAQLIREPKFRKRTLVCAFEGMDAAGKGGAIRRVAKEIDPRMYRIIPISAPSDEERSHPYLWRFWRQLPRQGRVTIFDRSWYGRVLVERIEGFCTQADWMRAYSEINEFEEQIVRSGGTVCKFWLQIDQDEQLRRFKAREKTRFKQFKITPDDWRNRKKWGQYQEAAADMIDRTSTPDAPWTLIESNDKRHARLKILKTIVNAVEQSL